MIQITSAGLRESHPARRDDYPGSAELQRVKAAVSCQPSAKGNSRSPAVADG